MKFKAKIYDKMIHTCLSLHSKEFLLEEGDNTNQYYVTMLLCYDGGDSRYCKEEESNEEKAC